MAGWLVAPHAQDTTDERARAEAEFYEYVSTSYRYFMAVEDAMCEELDGAKAGEFEERAAAIKADTVRLQAVSGVGTRVAADGVV